MTIDLTIDPELSELRTRVTDFIRTTVLPAEAEMLRGPGAPDDVLRRTLQQAARNAGLFAPTVPSELGGLGLDMREQSVILEAAGRSLLGPLALHCAAPDEGNILLLEKVADNAQRDRFLKPLAAAEVRSCFAMTEPAPGAGSDPTQLQTSARKTSTGWILNGRKWFTTGADGAAFAIVMARTGTDTEPSATMFLVTADTPGLRLIRHVPSLDQGFTGGHCEIGLDSCEVTDDAVLGEVGKGFAYAQVRLAPARLTHCMRWLGLASRAHELALAHVAERTAFGSRLGELGMVQQQLADNEIDLAASRALIREAAWTLDQRGSGKYESSVTKTFTAEAVGRIVDRSVQLCGALGISADLPLAAYLREVRPFRIYDGPSETHRWSIARRALRRQEAATGSRPSRPN
ncbi:MULTISPECIES: acyl-CoA dehydrogenase family protein [Streptomyces]|uniref:acyl-CoA dehydrogenase family protein n=1 Tax=Streptomyces TaxID=1883 RepID=UPI0006AD5B1A|nr:MULTISPECIES: acyl-CoA dehydrogenase family protein [Streptomyces]ALC27016.1 acyl-CoA dehydrogenase [Streptomyces sp. CFMR 7]RZF06896.1 acyl-CoA dehydrogenase [Streptomyces albidoflavus]